jgi:hypothetical protein
MGLCNRVAHMKDAAWEETLMALIPARCIKTFNVCNPVAQDNQEWGRRSTSGRPMPGAGAPPLQAVVDLGKSATHFTRNRKVPHPARERRKGR